jgi:hypothetical protein
MFTRKKLFLCLASAVLLLVLSPTRSAVAKAFVFNHNLSFGSFSQDVKELQKFLNGHGFPLAISGFGSRGEETAFFGRLTQASLVKFQKTNHIYPAWGYFGPLTRAFINTKNSVAPAPLENGAPISPVSQNIIYIFKLLLE